jgi:CubicO group peptidase (beta-lactamase class C family)
MPFVAPGVIMKKIVSILCAAGALNAVSLILTAYVAKPVAGAYTNAIQAQSQASGGSPILTSEDVQTHFDSIIPLLLKREGIAGAAVTVVKDGRIFFARGYGYAEIERKVPVSAETTLFRQGSVSKLFTWTAVMQLVEQGKLDLDVDVAQYLDFRIPSPSYSLVTLKNLMTHTAGFQELPRRRALSLRTDVERMWPPQIFQPGNTAAYSNFGAMVASYIVSRVSGQPFERYAGEQILKPLNMSHSTFAQPPPAALAPDMSSGYQRIEDRPIPFTPVPGAGSGGLSASLTDMGRFMLAQLQQGQLEGMRILKAESVERMHRRQFASMPVMNGITLGWFEREWNGSRGLWHGGDLPGFHSLVYLLPEAGVGLAFSQNSDPGLTVRFTVVDGFLDRYFPARTRRDKIRPDLDEARSVSGWYQPGRRIDSPVQRLGSLRLQSWIGSYPDGTLRSDGITNARGERKILERIAPLLYQARDGQERLGFRKNSAGTWEAVPDEPFVTLQRIPWFQRRRFVERCITGCLMFFALSVLAWPVGVAARRYYGVSTRPDGAAHPQRVWTTMICMLNLFCVAFGIWFFQKKLQTPDNDLWIRALQGAGIVAAAGALVASWNLWCCMRTRNVSWGTKPHAVGCLAAALTIIALAAVFGVFDPVNG